jgi:competence protein ComEC
MEAQPRAPLALAAIVFACGILLSKYWLVSPARWGWSAAALALCTIVAVAIKSLRPAQVAAFLALLCAGAFARVATPSPRLTAPPPEFLNVKDVEIVGHVTNDGALLAGGGPRERFDLQTETIELNGRKFVQPEETQDDNAPAIPHMAYGARVRLTAKLRLPRNFRNPGAFDYEGYLHGLNISALASVKSEGLEFLPGTSGSRLGFWRSRVRNSILQHIHQSGLWSREDAAIFSAMIMGDDSLLLRDVREEFQQTGVYHLLVVSGMNVALLAFALFWLARRLRLPQWSASLLTIVLSVCYAYLAGMGVPIMRGAHAFTIPGGASSLSRSQRTERHRLRRSGRACSLTCCAVRAWISINVPGPSSHYRHQPAYFGTNVLALPLRPKAP